AVEFVGGAGVADAYGQIAGELDRLHHTDVGVRRDDAECGHVLAVHVDLAVGEVAPVHTGGLRTFQEGVVDVGYVVHGVDLVTRVPPDPIDQSEGQIGEGMSKMRGVVRGDPTDVHPDPGPGRRDVLLPGRGVVDTQRVTSSR